MVRPEINACVLCGKTPKLIHNPEDSWSIVCVGYVPGAIGRTTHINSIKSDHALLAIMAWNAQNDPKEVTT